jgi:hypothetical protein
MPSPEKVAFWISEGVSACAFCAACVTIVAWCRVLS